MGQAKGHMPAAFALRGRCLGDDLFPICQQMIVAGLIFAVDPADVYAGLFTMREKVDIQRGVIREDDLPGLLCVKSGFQFHVFFGCFADAARLLAPGGTFVIEAFIPDLLRYDSSKKIRSVSMDSGKLHVDLVTVDLLQQQITNKHMILTPGGSQTYPVRMRFAFPAELDLMARLAGLGLRERWGDWDGLACTGESGKHISVYELAGA